MSEAIILYRGRGGVDPESLKPQTITSNGTYKAPVTGNYWVAVVGGGGGGGGGCRNSWNVSQVFYGAGGTRGTLNAGNVFLNAGDEVSVTLGAGGSAGVNNTTVVSNNSRGTNGGTGSTSAFGSYRSGAGGTYGAWSWSYHYKSWNNNISNLSNGILFGNGGIISYDVGVIFEVRYNLWGYYSNGMPINGAQGCIQWRYVSIEDQQNGATWNHIGLGNRYRDDSHILWSRIRNYTQYNNYPIYNPVGLLDNNCYGIRVENKQVIHNITTRCYTSIQQGTWWYLNNNQVSTSGTRTYRSDGGASGSAGNAGFIVIVPPTI